MGRASVLPASLAPRGLSRAAAAEFVGISATKFDDLVRDGRMPQPKHIDARRVWDRVAVELAFAELPDRSDDGENPWDAVK
jgi:predicted DNA-binding transcriptional regulator AlpA